MPGQWLWESAVRTCCFDGADCEAAALTECSVSTPGKVSMKCCGMAFFWVFPKWYRFHWCFYYFYHGDHPLSLTWSVCVCGGQWNHLAMAEPSFCEPAGGWQHCSLWPCWHHTCLCCLSVPVALQWRRVIGCQSRWTGLNSWLFVNTGLSCRWMRVMWSLSKDAVTVKLTYSLKGLSISQNVSMLVHFN